MYYSYKIIIGSLLYVYITFNVIPTYPSFRMPSKPSNHFHFPKMVSDE